MLQGPWHRSWSKRLPALSTSAQATRCKIDGPLVAYCNLAQFILGGEGLDRGRGRDHITCRGSPLVRSSCPQFILRAQSCFYRRETYLRRHVSCSASLLRCQKRHSAVAGQHCCVAQLHDQAAAAALWRVLAAYVSATGSQHRPVRWFREFALLQQQHVYGCYCALSCVQQLRSRS